MPPGQDAVIFGSEPGYLGFDTYDLKTQLSVSHHFYFSEEDGRGRLWRSQHRIVWPTELDLMAQLAGMELESRHSDWVGSEFTSESRSHMSVYRLPTAE